MSETPPSTDTTPDAQQLIVRRAPTLMPFLLGGAVVGVLIALVIVGVQAPIENYSTLSAFGFLAMVLGIPGLGVGGLIWLLVDRRSKKRTTTVYARVVTDPAAADAVVKSQDWDEYTDRQQRQAQDQRDRVAASQKASKKSAKKSPKTGSSAHDTTDS